jgi:cbb3-type cytochrome oxidase cytochrome c subunit
MTLEQKIWLLVAVAGLGMVCWLLWLIKMKPEKSAMATSIGIGLTFSIGLLFTILIPSFNQNWTDATADHLNEFHAVYKVEHGMLYRQWPDGTEIEATDSAHPTGGVPAIEHDGKVDPDGTMLGYTPLEQYGRRVYQREGCMYCHTQQIRPLYGDEMRFSVGASLAIPSDEREYVFDQPHFLGTRRIGPDLSREGGKYSNDWHFSHFYSPRQMVPGSIMPAFTWLFKTKDVNGAPLAEPEPTDDARALVAYVQTLGYGRLVYDPAVYSDRGGWGPWLKPADQQLYQKKGNTMVERAVQPIHGGDVLSPTNRIVTPTH